ncbi:MAG: DUF167 family protein [Devosia sp.]
MSAAEPVPYRITDAGLTVRLRVTPNASASRIEGIELRDDGEAVLKLRVTAVPDKGRANAAVVTLLAAALGVPKSALTLMSGETARLKTLAVSGPGAELAERLAALLAAKSA